jgi:hypothetical protein
MVTDVPPAIRPEGGVTELIVGCGVAIQVSVMEPGQPAGTVPTSFGQDW